MDDEQHAAVWTLMKYFKARELWVVGLQTSPLPNCEKSEIGWRAKAFRHVEINHDLGVCRRDFKTPSLVVQRLSPAWTRLSAFVVSVIDEFTIPRLLATDLTS